MSERIVIWLEEQGPVRVDPDKWPVIREGTWSGGLFGAQKYHMKIREHKDGRLIVHGEQRPPLGDYQIRSGRVAARLRDPHKGLLKQAIAAGKDIGLSQGVVQDFIAPLLAVDLD